MLTLGTHSGMFHLDDVLSTIMLRRIYPNSKLIRTRDKAILDSCDIVYDVGSVYNPDLKRFDHHQRGFDTKFSSKYDYKMSSAGLVYKNYTNELFVTYGYKKDENYQFIVDKIYEEYILGIDANDNGYERNGNYEIRSLATAVKGFNKSVDENDTFEKAVDYIKIDFDNYMNWVFTDWLFDFKYAKQCVDNCQSVILVADKHVSSGSIAIHAEKQKKDLKFLIRKEPDQFRIYGIPAGNNTFKCKAYLKESWRGLRNNSLVDVSGISTATFVHANGFTGGALNLDDAIEMCMKSIKK